MTGPCEVVVVVVDVEVLVDVDVLVDVSEVGDDVLVVFVVVGGLDVCVGLNGGGANVPDDGPGRGVGVTGTTGGTDGTEVMAGIVFVIGPSDGATGGLTTDGSTRRGAWLVGGCGVFVTFAGSTCWLR